MLYNPVGFELACLENYLNEYQISKETKYLLSRQLDIHTIILDYLEFNKNKLYISSFDWRRLLTRFYEIYSLFD